MTRKLSLTVDGKNVAVQLHKGDLPDSVTFNGPVAVDSETMGLSLIRDPLCLVQISDGGPEAHLVQLDRANYNAPNLKRVLTDPERLKIFHFARFDIAMFMRDLSIITAPLYCTKIASKLVRTYTDRHGLKDLTKDVLHLHALKAKLDEMLAREGRVEIAQSCFDFLPTRAALDLAGWEDTDIFAHQ